MRPHDIELFAAPEPDTVAATVLRVTRLGFEVRVDLEVNGDDIWAQVTRGTAEQFGLEPGITVYVRRAPHRAAIPVATP